MSSEDKEHEQMEEEEEDDKPRKEKKRNKRKSSPEKTKQKDAKKHKKSTKETTDDDDAKEPSTWSDLDKKDAELKKEAETESQAKSQGNGETALVSVASGSSSAVVVSVSKNEPWVNPNDWLKTHPQHFERIRVPEDIHFEKWTIPQGFRNAGKVTVRISNKKTIGTDLVVVGPWMAVYKAFFTMDGNSKDPKALEYITDKLRPYLEAQYFIGYLSKTWDANNDNGFGNDKDSVAYLNWWASLSYHFFKFVATNDDVLPGLKNLDEKPSPEIIYKRLIKHYRGPILQIPEKDATVETKTRAPLAAVDPASIKSCDKGVWIIKHKAPVYNKHESAPGREKPPAGPMVLQNEKMREAYDLNRIFNHVPLYSGRLKVAVPYDKANILGKDVVSDMVKVKPFLQGLDSKTNLPLFGISQRLQFARILKRGAAVDVQALANLYADGDLAGEEFIDFESSSETNPSAPAVKLDKQKATDLLALTAPTASGSAISAKGYQRI